MSIREIQAGGERSRLLTPGSLVILKYEGGRDRRPQIWFTINGRGDEVTLFERDKSAKPGETGISETVIKEDAINDLGLARPAMGKRPGMTYKWEPTDESVQDLRPLGPDGKPLTTKQLIRMEEDELRVIYEHCLAKLGYVPNIHIAGLRREFDEDEVGSDEDILEELRCLNALYKFHLNTVRQMNSQTGDEEPEPGDNILGFPTGR
ncbi:hypothetical protein C4577_07290 [Candidatus Parcubacteria bacterium]|nr:MAG: hypothetical protein C4577_07290 [Candidatus Parcubacteria bacterium]